MGTSVAVHAKKREGAWVAVLGRTEGGREGVCGARDIMEKKKLGPTYWPNWAKFH
jgi:hypothetical protein